MIAKLRTGAARPAATRRLALATVCLALAGCGGSGDDGGGDGEVPTPTATAERAAGRDDAAPAIGRNGFDPAEIYERDASGVVTIVALFDASGLDAVLQGGEDGAGGIGSGVVLNEDGEIATNAHVVTQGQGDEIQAARQLYVQFGDGNRVEAQLRGYDPFADVALVRVDPEGLDLNPLAFADSDEVRVGAPVAAMGSPFGEAQSLSVGVVSAVERDIEGLTNFSIGNAIQTDAAINPGNSGGPLVNAQGEVIGLNQSIRTRSGGAEGVGFALPSNLAQRSIEQLRETGEVDYAFLGVTSTTVYPQLARRFDLAAEQGAWLQEVADGTPGADAGLRGGGTDQVEFQASRFNPGGDVVVQLGDTRIETSSDLADAVEPFAPGDEVPVVYFRGQERRTGTITLGSRPLQPPPGG